jgi:hypothetical protein
MDPQQCSLKHITHINYLWTRKNQITGNVHVVNDICVACLWAIDPFASPGLNDSRDQLYNSSDTSISIYPILPAIDTVRPRSTHRGLQLAVYQAPAQINRHLPCFLLLCSNQPLTTPHPPNNLHDSRPVCFLIPSLTGTASYDSENNLLFSNLAPADADGRVFIHSWVGKLKACELDFCGLNIFSVILSYSPRKGYNSRMWQVA